MHEREAITDDIADAEQVLEADKVFKSLVVQRSRAYAKDSQIQEKGVATSFPERKAPQIAAYSAKKTYGQLLENFEKAFEKQNPLFSLPSTTHSLGTPAATTPSTLFRRTDRSKWLG